MEIDGNWWKLVEIGGNWWKLVERYGKIWTYELEILMLGCQKS